MSEIRRHEDDANGPPPCKVLCADGQFTPLATPDIRERYSGLRDIIVQPKFQYSALGTGHTSRRAAKERAVKREAKRRPRPLGRPKNLIPGRGQGWNCIPGLTVERILELQARGMIAEQIGKVLGCKAATIYKHLRNHRRSSAEAGLQDDTLRTCPQCGGRKWPSKPICCYCSGAHVGARKG